MIKEAYVSFETAKLLKEKGFNEKCRGGYHYEFDNNDNPIVMLEEWMAQPYNNDFVDEGFLCSAPTHQMAMAWLREVHKVNIEIHYNRFGENYRYIIIYKPEVLDDIRSLGVFYHYEEAVEAALKYSLENLI